MRVVHFAPAILPYQTQLYNEIAKRLDLHVVYLSDPNLRGRGQLWTDYDDQWGTEPRFNYSYADTKSYGISALDLLVTMPRRLGTVLDDLDPDVVTVTGWGLASLSPLTWARKHRIPAVMWCESNRRSGLLRDPISNAYRRWMLHLCDGYFTVGQAARDYVIQLGAAPARCVVALLPSAGSIHAAERLGPEGGLDQLRILWVGRLIKRKRPETAVEVFARFAREFSLTHLTIVGSGPLETNVRLAAERAGGSVELAGHVEGERLGSIYARHDILLVTAVREVWGLVVNEALTNGLYVIASDEVGAANSLLEDHTGIVVPADDVGAFVEALRGFAAERHNRAPNASGAGLILSCTPAAFADHFVQAISRAVPSSERVPLSPDGP